MSRLYADTDIAHQIEQLPCSLFWVALVLAAFSLAPYAILQHGSRRWLRRFYPDVPALRWNAMRIALLDGRTIPWADVKLIWVNPLKANSLEIHTDLWGKNGKVVIHRMLLLDPEGAHREIKSAFVEFKTRANQVRLTRNMRVIEAEARKNWSNAMAKTTSQLRAEGIPTTDAMALFRYFLDKASSDKSPSVNE